MKRKRTENWTARDKRLLRELCAERLNIIENKCVDTENNRLKRECWNEINDAFNSVSEIKRDVPRIQFQWRNMKMKAKAAKLAYQNALNKPADEGPPPEAPSKEDTELMQLVSNEIQKIDTTVFDMYEADVQIKDENISADTTLDEFADGYKDNDFEKDYFTESNHNLSQDTAVPNNSRFRSSKKIQKKKKIVHDSQGSHKLELFELTKAHMIEEHEARMEVLRLEQQCRQKELEKINLQIDLMRK